MQFIPTQSEFEQLGGMDETTRLHYFLTRVIEAEEIWALSDAHGWILQESDGQDILQVWPYKQLALDYAVVNEVDYYPNATSLDNFAQNLLGQLISQGIALEIMPYHHTPGTMISADKLYELLNSMQESGEYYLEG